MKIKMQQRAKKLYLENFWRDRGNFTCITVYPSEHLIGAFIKNDCEHYTITIIISNNNSYDNQTVKYIVIHNTDNYAVGASARIHAKAQHDGNFKGYSAHVFVDDTSAYQATPYNRGAWHIGWNYGGRLFGIANNRNAIGIEMCVQAGYNYEQAFQNTVDVCRQLMKQYKIDSDHVIQHYDACAKNCPSAIRAHGDWDRFKAAIKGAATTTTKRPSIESAKPGRMRNLSWVRIHISRTQS